MLPVPRRVRPRHHDRVRRLLVVFAFAWAATPGAAHAQEERGRFTDPVDGKFDVSSFLATPAGFLPSVQPITEPALDYGLRVGATFIHRPPGWDIEQARRDFEERRRMSVPSITQGFGGYTASDSWFVGLGHLQIWDEGRWRWAGGGVYSDLALSVAQDVPGLGERIFDYRLEGWGVAQSLRYRVGSDLYLGVLQSYFDMEASFRSDVAPGLEPELSTALSSLGASISLDRRNNTFTTDRGAFLHAAWRQFDEAIGSDANYARGRVAALVWIDAIPDVVTGFRLDASIVGEGAPFWAQPAVDLRGVPRGQYVGDDAGALEAELRWDVSRRWSLVGFGGAGWYGGEDSDAWTGAGGFGIRYLLARAFGIRGGLDFAWGPDGFALYLTTGSPWATF